MNWPRIPFAASIGLSLLGTLTAWCALLSWRAFTEHPGGTTWPLFLVALSLGVSGGVLRGLRRGVLLSTAVQVLLATALVLWTMTGSPLGTDAWGALGDLLDAGRNSAQRYTSPVPAKAPGIHALLVVGGAVALVALDLIASTLRQVAISGLALLAVFSVPGMVTGQPPTVGNFLLLTVCFLALLQAHQSVTVRRWGRALGPPGSTPEDAPAGPAAATFSIRSSAVVQSAARLSLVAIAAALVLPPLVPTLDVTVLKGVGPGAGGDEIEVLNPIADMRRDLVRGRDHSLLRITTNDPDPSYLRLSVLSRYTGRAWTPGARTVPAANIADGTMPWPDGLTDPASRRPYSYDVWIGPDFKSSWLPVLAATTSVEAGPDWRFDRSTLDVMSVDQDVTTANLRYLMTASRIGYDATALDAARPAAGRVARTYRTVPSTTPEIVRRLAQEVTADAQTPYRKARALQDWFRTSGEFEYTLENPPLGSGNDTLASFLGDGPQGRRGYCEQFASAMAVMARTLGMPSRVVVGFLQPDEVGASLEESTFEYSTHDLHTWPEVFFPGSGWVPFEPTPAARAVEPPSHTRAQLPTLPTPSASASSASSAPRPNARPTAVPLPTDLPGAAAQQDQFPWGVVLVSAALLVLVAGLAGLTPGWVRRRRSRHRAQAGDAESAWAEIRDLCVDLGTPPPPGRSLRETGGWLIDRFGSEFDGVSAPRSGIAPRLGVGAAPDAEVELSALVGSLERLRYAPSSDSDQVEWPESTLAALRRGGTSAARRRAHWWPRSVFIRSRNGRDTGSARGPGAAQHDNESSEQLVP